MFIIIGCTIHKSIYFVLPPNIPVIILIVVFMKISIKVVGKLNMKSKTTRPEIIKKIIVFVFNISN